MIRLFAAVEVPEEIGRDLQRRQQGLPGARWRPSDSLHVTLRFFGDVHEHTAADIDTELASIDHKPFDLSLEGAGAFGEGHRARAVWAGAADSAPLRQLAAKTEAGARRAGLKPETRNYKPHVTLAYLKRSEPDRVAAWIRNHNLLKSPPFRVTWFGLYSSVTHPEGSRYTLEREYPLG